MMKANNFILFATLIAVLVGCNQATVESEDSPKPNPKFLSLSDIHFDPFYDTSLVKDLASSSIDKWDTIFQSSKKKDYGVYKLDANYRLFKSALTRAKEVEPNPDFVIISGDFLAHFFEDSIKADVAGLSTAQLDDFIFKTMSFVTNSLRKTFPKAIFYPVLGNNDSFCGDYMITPNGNFLKRITPLWLEMLNGKVDETAFKSSFMKGGYYTANSPTNPKHKIIGLNTILFSTKFQDTVQRWRENYCQVLTQEAAQQAAKEQMHWLETQLKQAKDKQEKVWLVYHIPPGINAYSTIYSSKSNCADKISMYWHEDWNQEFIQTITKDASVITAQFGGHSHMDNFLTISDSSGKAQSFVHITPAISPIFQNNPGFLHYTYESTSTVVKDYDAHYFTGIQTPQQPEWKLEYNFGTTYKEKELSANSFVAISKKLNTDKALRQHYIDYFIVEDTAANGITDADWQAFNCTFTATSKSEYQACYCTDSP